MKQGKAYGFFDCKASKKEVETELLNAREIYRTPSELELSLTEVKDLGRGIDHDLLEFIREKEIYPTSPERVEDLVETANPIKMTNLGYMLEATYPNATNEETANELGEIMAGLNYRFSDDGPFNTTIVAKIDGEYLFKGE